ncbi:hypothetical protein TRIUR3_02335 [Triticum urartu]|uniref:Uncharacterized protein n=1 Tax=Triticum urartu TaxID=4572 RepID=M7ZP57_TRIUA|nr:hypothetical protein TRIUR3_02335 [Triticum urartu]
MRMQARGIFSREYEEGINPFGYLEENKEADESYLWIRIVRESSSEPGRDRAFSGAPNRPKALIRRVDANAAPLEGSAAPVGFAVTGGGHGVHGLEYAFGAHDLSTSGVFEVEPKCCPGYVYRRSVTFSIASYQKAFKSLLLLMEQPILHSLFSF